MENLKYVKKSEKHQETKGFLRLAVNQNNEFSRPPRYDRFDIPPHVLFIIPLTVQKINDFLSAFQKTRRKNEKIFRRHFAIAAVIFAVAAF